MSHSRSITTQLFPTAPPRGGTTDARAATDKGAFAALLAVDVQREEQPDARTTKESTAPKDTKDEDAPSEENLASTFGQSRGSSARSAAPAVATGAPVPIPKAAAGQGSPRRSERRTSPKPGSSSALSTPTPSTLSASVAPTPTAIDALVALTQRDAGQPDDAAETPASTTSVSQPLATDLAGDPTAAVAALALPRPAGLDLGIPSTSVPTDLSAPAHAASPTAVQVSRPTVRAEAAWSVARPRADAAAPPPAHTTSSASASTEDDAPKHEAAAPAPHDPPPADRTPIVQPRPEAAAALAPKDRQTIDSGTTTQDDTSDLDDPAAPRTQSADTGTPQVLAAMTPSEPSANKMTVVINPSSAPDAHVDAARARLRDAVSSVANQSVLRQVATGSVDVPGLGRIAVRAERVGVSVDVRVASEHDETHAVLHATQGALAADLRKADVPLGHLRFDQGGSHFAAGAGLSSGQRDTGSGHGSRDEADAEAEADEPPEGAFPARVRIVL